MKFNLILVLSLCPLFVIGQELTANQLLDKSISFHDPDGSWETFDGNLNVVMETPNSTARDTKININLPAQSFVAEASKDNVTTTYKVVDGKCDVSISDTTKEAPDCERAVMYRDYYTYLYGLPMKLKDPGTNLDPKVTRTKFKGKEYLVLKVFYDEGVGSDVWQFYFDPETYAMEVYQFFKGDPMAEGKNTGEYILLSELESISNIKMPKVRAWYYNKDDKYLGTDILQK